jgi:hypothetical protein
MIGGSKRKSIYNSINLNRAYAYRMWTLSNLITTDGTTLKLRSGALRGEKRQFLDEYAANGTYIDFANAKEFLAWMGDPTQKPTLEAALDIYMSRGDLFAAAEIKKAQGASKTELKNFRRMMIDEKTLEDNIEANFDDFARRVGMPIELVGRQYATTVGPIDLLARNTRTGTYVVIELKKGRSADKVFGQLSRYMGWVKKNLMDGEQPEGIIVASRIDDTHRTASICPSSRSSESGGSKHPNK